MDSSTLVFPYPVDGAPRAAVTAAWLPVDAPTLSVLDSAAERGDGAFETLGVVDGRPQALDAHLQRLAHSARLLDLPPLDLIALADTCVEVASDVTGAGEHSLKLVISRGGPTGDGARAWIVLGPMPDYTSARTAGLAVVTLSKGCSSTIDSTAPWLLLGAKTLSYASNMAALREARRRGADDVLFETTDGYLLEGPTSTLIVRHGDRLTTPDPALGILHGTTQRDLFAQAEAWGLTASYGRPRADDLRHADAAWLVSSVRMAAPLRSVDGEARSVDADLTSRMNDFLLSRR